MECGATLIERNESSGVWILTVFVLITDRSLTEIIVNARSNANGIKHRFGECPFLSAECDGLGTGRS